jgi:hypothetical protein
MTPQVASVGGLNSDQVKSVLRSALLAPSTRNTQPWLFRCTSEGIEVRADPARALPIADPDRRELRMSCGAALLNLRVAIQALGIHPTTTLLPRRDDPQLMAIVRPFTTRRVDSRSAELARAVPLRRTNRRPFTSADVPWWVLGELRAAAEAEHAWMPKLGTEHRERLYELVHAAHRAQVADPDFLAEWRRWTGRASGTRDGVPTYAAGVSTSANDSWVLRDFAPQDGIGEGTDPGVADPFVVVIGSFDDRPIDHLRAGQAMERVLLTATSVGLDASFISQPVEVPAVRAELKTLLGGGLWPQILFRIGYGTPMPWTPRRPLNEVMLAESGLVLA